jgi:hypothetical protein
MNQQSLDQANALLAEASLSTQPGEAISEPLGELGRRVGLPSPLALARAVRALVSRGRLSVADGEYRLLEPRPVEAGERVSVAPRGPRRPRRRARREAEGDENGVPAYSDLGRAVVDRLVELARETAALQDLTQLRRELREERSARARAEERASDLHTRNRDLDAKLGMAEENLRRVIGVVRQKSTPGAGPRPTDPDAQALLAILRGNGASEDEGAPADEAVE